MSLKAGRVGVASDQVDEFGVIKSEATGGYTKQEADAKFETQAAATSALAEKQPITLAVPIEMLSGTKLTVENALQGLNSEKLAVKELWSGTVDISDGQDHEITLNDSQLNYKYLRLRFASSTNVHSVADFPAENYIATRFSVTANTVITSNGGMAVIRLTANSNVNKLSVRVQTGTFASDTTLNVVKVEGIL